VTACLAARHALTEFETETEKWEFFNNSHRDLAVFPLHTTFKFDYLSIDNDDDDHVYCTKCIR